MKALISSNEESIQITAWNGNIPTFTILGYRVAEVTENAFEVASALFWVDCDSSVVADRYYYDVNSKTILVKPADAVKPQPISKGTSPA
jgi:hypothetical protein